MVEIFPYFIRYSWVFFIFVVIANAVHWRLEARARIRADPSLRAPLNRLYAGFAFWVSLPFVLMGVGIVTGSVETIFDYLRIDFDNPYILGFQVLLFALDALLIYWIFVRGGDDLLALHTELEDARPKLRVAARIGAICLPVLHVVSLYNYQVTFAPHFGQ